MSSRSSKRARLDASALNVSTASSESGAGGTLRDGVITRIRLNNFMNHAELDLRLAPGVNVITGANGAGKSSILQAVVLGLGARADVTKRSKEAKMNVAQFVRHECVKADVKVHLYNGGEEAYCKDKYGDEIVFGRSIFKNSGASSHYLRDKNGKEVYTKGTYDKVFLLINFMGKASKIFILSYL